MSEIRKLPASAGAEWLVSGFTLLRKAPLALGLLGVIWAVAALLVMSLAMVSPALSTLAQLLMALAGPLFFGGLVWAVREVDQGRVAQPAHLLQGLQEGRALNLLASLLPQLVAGLFLGVLLLVLIGSSGLQHLSEVMVQLNAISQAGAQPDPAQIEELMASLPAMRILLWLALVVVTFLAMALALFTLPPQVMFEHRNGLQAMRLSLRACLHNVLAMLVFFLLAFVAVFAIYFGVMLVALIAQLIGGTMLALFVAQLLLMGVVMPVFAGAIYTAWKQMFGQQGPQTPPPMPGPNNVFAA
ncbi:MAG: BPSS1780 family membrane protein [Stenotrophomonas sp.]